MSGSAWLDLEKIAKGISTPVNPKKTIEAPASNKPSGSRQQKSASTGPGRSAAEERTPKRRRRVDQDLECEFELENVGPKDFEAFKKDPLLVCSDICRSASQVFKDLKIEAASAQQERDAALKRLTELEPQIKTLEEKDSQLEEAKKAKEAAEKEKKLADEERAKMSKKIKELMSQNKSLQDQVARVKEEKAEAVATEVKRIAGLARGAALEQFDNAVSQMKVFNAARGAQFDGKIVNPEHAVEEGEIVLPQKVDDEGKIIQKRAVIFGRPKKN